MAEIQVIGTCREDGGENEKITHLVVVMPVKKVKSDVDEGTHEYYVVQDRKKVYLHIVKRRKSSTWGSKTSLRTNWDHTTKNNLDSLECYNCD